MRKVHADYQERTHYYTTGEAAKLLGLSDVRVRELVREGQLRATRTVGGTILLIDAESLWNLKRERELNPPRRGRPRKKAVGK